MPRVYVSRQLFWRHPTWNYPAEWVKGRGTTRWCAYGHAFNRVELQISRGLFARFASGRLLFARDKEARSWKSPRDVYRVIFHHAPPQQTFFLCQSTALPNCALLCSLTCQIGFDLSGFADFSVLWENTRTVRPFLFFGIIMKRSRSAACNETESLINIQESVFLLRVYIIADKHASTRRKLMRRKSNTLLFTALIHALYARKSRASREDDRKPLPWTCWVRKEYH